METAGEPDTTSQIVRQINRYKGRQMNWRQPESRKPPAMDWETNWLLYGETNELETSREPDTTSQTGRQMDCYLGRQMESRTHRARLGDRWIAIRGDKSIGDIRRAGHHQPDWEKWIAIRGDKWIGDIRRAGHHSQTGRQMNCYKRRQMNWRYSESRTPPARLGNKWVAIRGNKWIGDIRRAGHQPDWETNELL